MPLISRVHAREVLDSRGYPTVECEIHTNTGQVGSAIVPSGKSTGTAEALELRDGDPNRYDFSGMLKAVANVNEILGPAIAGLDAADQQAVDARLLELDSTPQKSRLGGNAILAASLAAAHAGAAASGVPLFRHLARVYQMATGDASREPKLPLPMVNMISGGLHAGVMPLDFQDVMIQPVGAKDYPTGLEWVVRVYRRLGELLTMSGYEGQLVGDEGGYGPRLAEKQAVEFVVRAIEEAGLRPGEDLNVALDVAATHFYNGSSKHYCLLRAKSLEEAELLTSDELIDLLAALSSEFPIASIEDGLAEEDWSGWQELTRRLGGKLQLVGDDLFATNRARVQRGIELGAANSVLVKVNQIGTLSETFATMSLARSAAYSLVVSARSGETEDSTIADLAVGCAAEQIKIGSIVRSERLAKYNRLLRIAEQLEQ